MKFLLKDCRVGAMKVIHLINNLLQKRWAIALVAADSFLYKAQMVLPLAWVLDDKPVLLIGGGKVGEGRAVKLLEANASVTVVSPEVTGPLMELVDEKRIVWHATTFDFEHLEAERWEMVMTALPDRALSREIAEKCRELRIPVNAADIPESCDFYFGANRRYGPLNIMISSTGSAPRLTARLMDQFEGMLAHHQVDGAIASVGKLRRLLRQKMPREDQSRARMAIMKGFCDKLTFMELANLTDPEIDGMVRGALCAVGACPSLPGGSIADAVEDFCIE